MTLTGERGAVTVSATDHKEGTAMTQAERDNWIDWRQMDPMVRPADLDAIDRAQIIAAQQPANANRPILETA